MGKERRQRTCKRCGTTFLHQFAFDLCAECRQEVHMQQGEKKEHFYFKSLEQQLRELVNNETAMPWDKIK